MAWDIKQVKKELCGPTGLVMATFNEDLSLNVGALKDNIRFMLDEGMKTGRGCIICPCGTGEYVHLNRAEHAQRVRAALEVTDGKLPVVVGLAGTDVREVVELGRQAQKAGAKYAMVPPPYYYDIDQDGIFEWYRILSESLDLGIMAYEQSWRGDLGTYLGVRLIERLAGLDNLVSLKYGSPSYFQDMIVALDNWHDRFAFIDNSLGYTAVVGHMHGATGFISGPSTWWPEFELKFYQLMTEGKYVEADKWHARIGPYMELMSGEYWQGARFTFQTAVVKASMEYVGLYGGPLRPPLRALNAEERKELWAVMERMGVKKIQ